MNQGVWVLGGGGHAKVVVATLENANETVLGIFDDDGAKKGGHLLGAEIIGATPEANWWADEERRAIIAIGDNHARAGVSTIAAQWAVAKHCDASVHPSVEVGEGSLICAGVVIQPDTTIGRHVIANTSCSIDHDCVISDFSHIGPGAHLAGSVSIGERSFVGAGATIVPGITIGSDVTVGAGAVVLRDVAAGKTVVGVPAREIGRE